MSASLACADRAFQPPSASARYFIIKSYNHENIGTSISNGVWATQAHNEKKLADAFNSGEEARAKLLILCLSA